MDRLLNGKKEQLKPCIRKYARYFIEEFKHFLRIHGFNNPSKIAQKRQKERETFFAVKGCVQNPELGSVENMSLNKSECNNRENIKEKRDRDFFGSEKGSSKGSKVSLGKRQRSDTGS